MTQEEKALLLKDLCARLPYGINIRIKYYDLQGDGELASRDVKLTAGNICYCFDNGHWVDIKPYLRSMSSMTEEEDKDWQLYKSKIAESCDELLEERVAELHNWFNLHHFDYRGLIEKGLALEAPEEMYKIE